jgi:hypothetical protein
MITQDDRTEEQKQTHAQAWVGTDPFMSGWGNAENGASFAGWACTYDDQNRCESWVRRRGDMQRVRLVALNGYNPDCADCHIYVFDNQDGIEVKRIYKALRDLQKTGLIDTAMAQSIREAIE